MTTSPAYFTFPLEAVLYPPLLGIGDVSKLEVDDDNGGTLNVDSGEPLAKEDAIQLGGPPVSLVSVYAVRFTVKARAIVNGETVTRWARVGIRIGAGEWRGSYTTLPLAGTPQTLNLWLYTNPATGSAWEPAELEGLVALLELSASDHAGSEPDVSKVTYLQPRVFGDVAVGRLELSDRGRVVLLGAGRLELGAV